MKDYRFLVITGDLSHPMTKPRSDRLAEAMTDASKAISAEGYRLWGGIGQHIIVFEKDVDDD